MVGRLINSREDIERNENETLAPFAAHSSESQGRVYPEDDHPLRSRFQRDRDRVIHSAAFRRLEYKTQVFVNSEGDHYRTRLTHTLEVAQISRTIARGLRLNEDLAETIALVHDLGHTPFGHAGEESLNDLMTRFAGKGFNHNRQSLRIVEHIERRYPDFPGLNLTYETREGIVKHETSYDIPEANEYNPELSPTLEAQIVNYADEIAYNCHDVDDGLFSEVIHPEEIMDIDLWRELVEESAREYPVLSKTKRQFHAIRMMINRHVTDLINHTAGRIEDRHIESLEDVRKNFDHLVGFSPKLTLQNKQIKEFLLSKMYRHHRLIRMSRKARRVLTALFEAYVDEPRQLPPSYADKIHEASVPQIICDYIAGMTDRFAIQEYNRLFDPAESV